MRIPPANKRNGVATLWVIVTMSAVLCLLGVVIELGNLWLARAELRTSLEAAALAAVDSWGDSGTNTDTTRSAARNQAVSLAGMNLVNGQTVSISDNATSATVANPNGNLICTGSVVILGNLTGSSPFTVQAGQAPTTDRAAHVQGSISVNSIIGKLCGNVVGPYLISAQVTARYDSGFPKTIQVVSVVCP